VPNAKVRYLGVGEEASYGAAPAALAGFIDVASASLDTPDGQAIVWEGVADRFGVVHAPGEYIPGGSIETPVDGIMTGWLLKWALGNVATTVHTVGVPDVMQHVFTAGDNLKSFTTAVGKDIFEHQFVGCMIDSLSLSVSDGFATFSATIVGQKDSKKALRVPSFQEVVYFSFSQVTATIGGSPVPVESLTLDIANALDGSAGVRLGSRFPEYIGMGRREVTCSADLTFDSTAQLDRFWGGAVGPTAITPHTMSLTMTGPLINGTSIAYSLTIDLPKVIMQTSNQEISGRDRIVQSVTMRALLDRTIGHDIRATLLNAHTAY